MTPAEEAKQKKALLTARKGVKTKKRTVRGAPPPNLTFGQMRYGKKLYVDSKPPRMNAKAVLGPDSPEFMRRQRRAKKIQIPVNVAPRGKAPVGEIRGDDSRFERLLGRHVVVRLVPRNDLDRGAEMRGQLVHVDDDEVVLRQIVRRHEEVRVSGKTLALTGALRCKTERIDLRIDRKKILSARVALEDVETPSIQP